MTTDRLQWALRRFAQLPAPVRLSAVFLVLLLLYLPLVSLAERREEARLARLSETAPARFLDLERSRHGMAAYLEGLAELRHFDRWRERAPNFLIGAWALADPDATAPSDDPGAHCLSGIVIEDGRIRYFGPHQDQASARYRIEHGEVLAQLSNGETLHISVPQHPDDQGRLAIAGPGRTTLQAFRCH